MNQKLKEVFKGKVVNKALTISTGVDEFPRYVVEYLIDNYCSEDTVPGDMEKVVHRLKENFVHGAEAEKIRHQIRENRHHSIIANLEARLVETEDKYWSSIGAINENFVNIPESIVNQCPAGEHLDNQTVETMRHLRANSRVIGSKKQGQQRPQPVDAELEKAEQERRLSAYVEALLN